MQGQALNKFTALLHMKCKHICILSKYRWPNQTCPGQHANRLRSHFHVVSIFPSPSLQRKSPWLSAQALGITARSTTSARLWIIHRSKATAVPCSTTSGPCPTSNSPPPACSLMVCSIKHSELYSFRAEVLRLKDIKSFSLAL